MAEQTEQRLADFKDNAAGALATIAANNTSIGVSRAPEQAMGVGQDKSHAAALEAARGIGSDLKSSLDSGRQQAADQSPQQGNMAEKFAKRGNGGHGLG